MVISMNSINIGKKILSFRHKNNMAIRDFSKVSNLSPALISQLERGKGNPSLSVLNAIANAMDTTLSELVKEELPNKYIVIKNNILYKENKYYKHYNLISDKVYNSSINIHKIEINNYCTYSENIFSDNNSEHILFIENGCVLIKFENEEYSLAKGDKIIIFPNIRYELCNQIDNISTIIAIKAK